MERTEHIGLHQWKGTDQFLREEFNEDFRRIDGAVGALEEKGYVAGTYSGTSDAARPLTVSVGFPPAAVIICQLGRSFGDAGVLLVRGQELTYNGQLMARLTEDGFTVSLAINGDMAVRPTLNLGSDYGYVAFR